jgi:opacity protein-like surface antigen
MTILGREWASPEGRCDDDTDACMRFSAICLIGIGVLVGCAGAHAAGVVEFASNDSEATHGQRTDSPEYCYVVQDQDVSAPPARHFYVAGIIGDSFATISSGGTNTASGTNLPNSGSISGNLFTAGGACGVASDRSHGQLRAEFEGRGRGNLAGETPGVLPPDVYSIEATNGWSVLANVWRDYFLTERLGIYGGGGIGAGGYTFTVDDLTSSGSSSAAGFAWQAGAGATYRIMPRMTLDLGYRFFDVGTLSTPLVLPDGSSAGNYTTAFSASELLLTIRVYEPFSRSSRARRP